MSLPSGWTQGACPSGGRWASARGLKGQDFARDRLVTGRKRLPEPAGVCLVSRCRLASTGEERFPSADVSRSQVQGGQAPRAASEGGCLPAKAKEPKQSAPITPAKAQTRTPRGTSGRELWTSLEPGLRARASP